MLRRVAPLLRLQRGFATSPEAHPFDAFFTNRDCGAKTGRAWRSSELRLKSFDDLQKLWFVLLKEKNMLLTYQELCRQSRAKMKYPTRLPKVKLSMKRIQTVIQHRVIEYKVKTIPAFKAANERRTAERHARQADRALKIKNLKRSLKIKQKPLNLITYRARKKIMFHGLKPIVRTAPEAAEEQQAALA